MATRTFEYASFGDGVVRVEYDVNDANWRVSRVRCVNNSEYAAIGYIYEGGALIVTAEAPANQTTTWNVSGVQLGWQPDYWNDLTQQWEKAGIEMNGYTFQAVWPGV